MAYIGNIPAENYASFLTETFTVSATTNYTLSHAVTNENGIRLVINGVVQQPGSGKAYTASGTTLTLTSATVSGDVMYAVYLGRALQTVNPPNASVGNSQTAPTIITGQTAETSIATDDTILIHDTSASALRKMTRANFVSGIGGVMTPAFQAQGNNTQTLTSGSATKITFADEVYDSSSKYDTSTSRFTPGEAGKFFIFANSRFNADNGSGAQQYEIRIYKNGAQQSPTMINGVFDVTAQIITNNVSGIVTSSNTTDYFEVYGYADGTNRAVYDSRIFGGYKIIE